MARLAADVIEATADEDLAVGLYRDRLDLTVDTRVAEGRIEVAIDIESRDTRARRRADEQERHAEQHLAVGLHGDRGDGAVRLRRVGVD